MREADGVYSTNWPLGPVMALPKLRVTLRSSIKPNCSIGRGPCSEDRRNIARHSGPTYVGRKRLETNLVPVLGGEPS
jgi:hypothetical protein